MTPEDILKYYGSKYKFSKHTGKSASTLANWIKKGFVPEDAQYRMESITGGALKTDWTNKDE